MCASQARQMHNDAMDTCPDTQVDLDVQIDHDLAKLSLEDLGIGFVIYSLIGCKWRPTLPVFQ